MSRTYRNSRILYSEKYKAYLRKPKTFNEIKQNEGLLHEDFEYQISGKNRISKRKSLPTVYDDIDCAGVWEDYNLKHYCDE